MGTTNLTLEDLKNDLISDLNLRTDEKILEPANRDLLSKLIYNAESKDEAIAIAELGTSYKRTGFHFDKKLEKIGTSINYFKKNEQLSFSQDKTAITHKLIIGDNYYALLNLSISYRGKIDVIYIDPPYGKMIWDILQKQIMKMQLQEIIFCQCSTLVCCWLNNSSQIKV